MIIDVRCAAISEPFNHQCHIHPLFLTNEIQVYKTCSMCGKEVTPPLNCSECDFVSCFRCATFPFKVRYEHDEHFLTLSYEEIESPYWCEVCEEVIASSKWLYTCNECGVTLHIECLLGKDVPYINYSLDIFLIGNYNKNRVTIVPNYGLSRPICDRCGRRCKDKQILECDGRRLCSYEELGWPFKPLFLDFQMPLIFMH
ncbi:unnamed protein product [Eruca vesicaria subsp. sativa]|uniref:Phorbol-ester/DAG-type domain-containing protein n=1 Tax=Eruca vesicaria subsp. sativa TaxID=29727 RepID=A0ABC8M4E1_ERUVS|nr:unnamed protein product [Eruca vesicaria subsp. sativa]